MGRVIFRSGGNTPCDSDNYSEGKGYSDPKSDPFTFPAQPIPVETPVTTTSLLFAISVFFFQARRRPPSMIDSVPMM